MNSFKGDRFNPFRPGNIAPPEMFSGRGKELLSLEQILVQTKNGNPQHFLIQGERGIGKSSLLSYLRSIAAGETQAKRGARFRFVVLNVDFEPSNNYFGVIKRIGDEFTQVVATQQRLRELAKAAWEVLSRFQVAGFGYTQHERQLEPSELLNDLAEAIIRFTRDCNKEYDGLLILMDEADKLGASANLGEFMKVFSERLVSRGCHKVSFGLAGLPNLLQKLRKSNDSSLRLFRILPLTPLRPSERLDAISRGLAEAERKNGFRVTMNPDAELTIATLSEGYPHFLQEFAYWAFDVDEDNVITDGDVEKGLYGEHGAIEQLGFKYFQGMYLEEIRSHEYRQVLRVIAEHPEEWVRKAEIKQVSTFKDSILDNAIRALKREGVIIAKEGARGTYRLATKAFGLWIKYYTRMQESSAGS